MSWMFLLISDAYNSNSKIFQLLNHFITKLTGINSWKVFSISYANNKLGLVNFIMLVKDFDPYSDICLVFG